MLTLLKRLWRLPYGFAVFCLIVYVISESIERGVLIASSIIDRPDARITDYLWTFPAGFLADAAMACLVGAPFVVLFHHLGKRLGHRMFRVVASIALVILVLAVGFEDVSTMLFWNEFASRFNSIAVNYLIFPREVIGNIRESFDFRIIGPALAAISLVFFLILHPGLAASLHQPRVAVPNRRFYFVLLVVTAISAIITSFTPFEVSANREANEIAANGIQTFLRAAWTNDAAYDGVYPGLGEQEAIALARAAVAQDNTRFLTPDGIRSLLRHVDNVPPPKRLNVVLIIEESFGATFADDLDNNRPGESISPNLTRLGREGLYFTNLYSTGLRTVRGLEAILTSFPPIPGIATTRRPGSDGMHSLPFVLRDQGYQTAFLYGGILAFDNMRAFLAGIGFDHLWDQADIADIGFKTAWGAADEYIFSEALKRLDAMHRDDKPMFLGILTVSNHRPYTFPSGRIAKNPKANRMENSATYADWAFGNFIERARKHDWFKDTVFVFIADHGPHVTGAAQVPVERYRIPLLIYAPTHIEPARIATIGSSMDVAPTLLGLLRVSYDSPFFGVDLLRVPQGQGRAFMDHSFSVAMARDGHLVTLEPRHRSRGYEFYAGPRPLTKTEPPDPETLRRAIAVIQTAHHMFYAGEYHRPKPTAETHIR